MNEQKNIEIVKQLFDAFNRGDAEAIVARCTDDVHWMVHYPPTIPWAGDFSGRANVGRFFSAIVDNSDVLLFEPKEFYADGNRVIALGAFACRSKETGKRGDADWVFRFEFRGDEVCSYIQFADPSLAEAFSPVPVSAKG
ncbi:MAG: nuclear transport factor 2 family protein [Armatimonadetes bacterium]|nr:nuclear transport factor 2 family protein [Armatimonadota bacterium]